MLAKDDLPVNAAWKEEKRKTTTIMEEPSDELHDKQKHERRYGRRFMAFGSELTALGCIEPNHNNTLIMILTKIF